MALYEIAFTVDLLSKYIRLILFFYKQVANRCTIYLMLCDHYLLWYLTSNEVELLVLLVIERSLIDAPGSRESQKIIWDSY